MSGRSIPLMADRVLYVNPPLEEMDEEDATDVWDRVSEVFSDRWFCSATVRVPSIFKFFRSRGDSGDVMVACVVPSVWVSVQEREFMSCLGDDLVRRYDVFGVFDDHADLEGVACSTVWRVEDGAQEDDLLSAGNQEEAFVVEGNYVRGVLHYCVPCVHNVGRSLNHRTPCVHLVGGDGAPGTMHQCSEAGPLWVGSPPQWRQ